MCSYVIIEKSVKQAQKKLIRVGNICQLFQPRSNRRKKKEIDIPPKNQGGFS